MTEDDDDLYSDLPEDSELAFLQLEDAFRQKLVTKTRQTQAPIDYMEYLNKTHAAAHALRVDVLQDMPQPEVGNALAIYSAVSHKIENYIIQVKIRNGRRTKGYSVALDSVTKEKVRHLIGQIKTIVDRLEVNVQKKEALYARITALSDEVDRDRTKYDTYAALAIEMSNTAGKVTRNLNPARKLLDSIAKLFSMAKEAEAGKPQLRLEAPRRQLAPPKADVAESDLETGTRAPEPEEC